MTNADTVRGIYANFARQNVPGVLERLAEDVEWDYAYADRGIPWLTPRRGRAGAGAFFQALSGVEMPKFDVKAVLGEGSVVVALVDLELVVRATGKRIVEVDQAHIWSFDDGGRVKRFRHSADTLQHHDALLR